MILIIVITQSDANTYVVYKDLQTFQLKILFELKVIFQENVIYTDYN